MKNATQNTVQSMMRVGNRIYTRTNGSIQVQWLGHGTTEPSDPAPRALGFYDRQRLALALLRGKRWVTNEE